MSRFRRTFLPIWSSSACMFLLIACPFLFSQYAAAPNNETQVLSHLNQVLRWSRQWASTEVFISRAGDEIYVENGRHIAGQAVKLEFQSALAQAALIGDASPKASLSSGGTGTINTQNILKMQQQISQEMQTLQVSLDTVNRNIATARPPARANLLTQRDTIQGQIQLAQALQENLQKLTSFATLAENASGVATELTAKIMALQRTVPGAAIENADAKGALKTPAAVVQQPATQLVGNTQSEGLIGQMGQMVHLIQTLRALDQLKDNAVALQRSTTQLRAPLLAALHVTLQQGQIELASASDGSTNASNGSGGQNSAPAQNNAAALPSSRHAHKSPQRAAAIRSPNAPTESSLEKQRAMTALVQHFKLLSTATLPLSQELILIDQSQANLNQLQSSVKHDYMDILRAILLKVATILIALGLIWLFSELWRRASFRYIRDTRRRRQFLVLRRVVTGFCMFVVILLGFVSDFSSLATYAGLITAGVAVALQAVILSIAAYFFLVGRYGVKVGDRVSVVYNGANSIVGDVVDIGLVRFYMMELAGAGLDFQPTGRICVFPNSILFQASPLFKQLPGTEYTWREVALTLHPQADTSATQKALFSVVDKLYLTYKAEMERQHQNVEENMGIYVDVPTPHPRMRLTGSAMEVMVRYPVPLRQAAEMDDRMVLELNELLNQNPSLPVQEGTAPVLRSPFRT